MTFARPASWTSGFVRNALIAPYLAAVFIILFTPFLFIFGVLLYRLIRPQETVEEANERALAQEAMLREMQTQHCQTCGRRVEETWLICPYCRGRLRALCPACNRIYELDWAVCAWCGIDPRALGRPAVVGPAPWPVLEPMAQPEAVPATAASAATADGLDAAPAAVNAATDATAVIPIPAPPSAPVPETSPAPAQAAPVPSGNGTGDGTEAEPPAEPVETVGRRTAKRRRAVAATRAANAAPPAAEPGSAAASGG